MAQNPNVPEGRARGRGAMLDELTENPRGGDEQKGSQSVGESPSPPDTQIPRSTLNPLSPTFYPQQISWTAYPGLIWQHAQYQKPSDTASSSSYASIDSSSLSSSYASIASETEEIGKMKRAKKEEHPRPIEKTSSSSSTASLTKIRATPLSGQTTKTVALPSPSYTATALSLSPHSLMVKESPSSSATSLASSSSKAKNPQSSSTPSPASASASYSSMAKQSPASSTPSPASASSSYSTMAKKPQSSSEPFPPLASASYSSMAKQSPASSTPSPSPASASASYSSMAKKPQSSSEPFPPLASSSYSSMAKQSPASSTPFPALASSSSYSKQSPSSPSYASSLSSSMAKTPGGSDRGDVKRVSVSMKKLQFFATGRKGPLSEIPPESVIRQPGVEKKGKIGTPVQVVTNLFHLRIKKKDAFYHYNVKFDPEPASTGFCRRLIREIEEQAGISHDYVADGSSLFCTQLLDEKRVKNLVAETQTTKYRISLIHVGSVQATSHVVIQLLNIIFNSLLQDHLNMKWMSGNCYDTQHPVPIVGTNYSLYPGFFSSILEYENGTRLMMDISHKLISTETVLDIIMSGGVSAVRAKIVGKIVHTRYNDRTYKVEDIHFDKSPMFLFNYRRNDISVLEYYKLRYNIQIRSLHQPLLAIRSKKKELRAGAPEIIFLVPELCHITGLTDEIRRNTQVMKKFAQHTRLEPGQRIERMTGFARKIVQNAEVKKVLNNFGVEMSSELVSTTARKLPKLSFLPRDLPAITRGRLLEPAQMRRWKIFYPSNVPGMDRDVTAFLHDLQRSCVEMGMACQSADLRAYRNDGELQELARSCSPDSTDMVLVVMKSDDRRYSALKKILCLQKPIPSQVVLCQNVTNRKPAVVSKIALQMNCKLGGSGWSVTNMNLQGTMVVGVDTYHDSERRNCSFAGVVASLDTKCSKYYTTWQRHDIGREVLISMRSVMTECLKEYQRSNGRPCERVILYRDGVGDGELDQLMKSELQEALGAIADLGLRNTKLTFIVVKKRINARFFAREGQGYRNPNSGTVVDSEATKPIWMDFYLINQEVRAGTVTPTHFNVIFNSTHLKVDELQLVTFQQCHQYYNWAGPIRVPAVCQYAHKVAFLIGQYLHDCPNEALKKKLFYL